MFYDSSYIKQSSFVEAFVYQTGSINVSGFQILFLPLKKQTSPKYN
jgi:hypothetical protein